MGDMLLSSVRVGFYCRVIFTCVNKMEAMYGRSRVLGKIEPPLTLLLRAAFHTLLLFYVRA